MSQNPKFWGGIKRVLLVLALLAVGGAVFCFVQLTGAKATFFGASFLILALNLGLIFFFIKINDNKRPMRRQFNDEKKEETSRFDFRKR